MREEKDLKIKQLHLTKKDLIEQMKLVEVQQAELESLRAETKI